MLENLLEPTQSNNQVFNYEWTTHLVGSSKPKGEGGGITDRNLLYYSVMKVSTVSVIKRSRFGALFHKSRDFGPTLARSFQSNNITDKSTVFS
jgi:hypothetical protein